MRIRPLILLTSGLLLTMSVRLPAAQEERESKRYAYSPPADTDDQVEVRISALDAQLARWLMTSAKAQLAIARFAADRADDQNVQDFADDLIAAHGRMLRQLGPIAGTDGQKIYSLRAAPAEPSQTIITDRQRVRATAADEVREKTETLPVEETKDAARGTGQESGPTGTRARDVRQGETGTDDARTIAEPMPRYYRQAETTGPVGVGTRGRTGVAGTTGDELRARDRRLDAFDRVGTLPVTEQNRRNEENSEERRARVRVEQSTRFTPKPELDAIMDDIGRQRTELVKRELGRSRGDMFDTAFLRHQVATHLDSLSVIRGLKGHVGSNLQSLLDEAQDTNWSQLSRAKELLYEIERASSQVAR